jgi:hypothetical protein
LIASAAIVCLLALAISQISLHTSRANRNVILSVKTGNMLKAVAMALWQEPLDRIARDGALYRALERVDALSSFDSYGFPVIDSARGEIRDAWGTPVRVYFSLGSLNYGSCGANEIWDNGGDDDIVIGYDGQVIHFPW